MRSARLFVLVLVAILGTAACSVTSPSAPIAFDDCFNRAPLYRTEHGCDEGN